MEPLRKLVEDGIKDALECKLGIGEADDGYIQLVEFYSGTMTPTRDDPDLQRVTQGCVPAILVTTGEGVYRDHTIGRQATNDFQLEFLYVSGNLRGQEERNRGGADPDPGIYQIIPDVRDCLFRLPLPDVCVGNLIPLLEEPVLRAPDLQIWHAVYAIDADAVHEEFSVNAPDLAGFDDEINFPDPGDGAVANPVLQMTVNTT